MLYFSGDLPELPTIDNTIQHDGIADELRLILEGDKDMKKNVSRLIMFCAVILGFMLVIDAIGFAHIKNPQFVAAHYVPGEEKPINDAVTLKDQTLSARES